MVMDGTPLGGAPVQPAPVMDATPLGAAPAVAPPVEGEAPQQAQLPPATPRVTSQGPTALEQVPVIGPPLQALGNIFRGGDPEPFRPADPNVQGLGPEYYSEQIQAADKGLQQASGPVETLGAVKDVGLAHLQEHKGEVSPIAARNKREMARLGYALATTGEPPPDMNPAYVASYVNDPFVKAFQGPDQENLIRSVNEGYTRADGTVYAAGDEAAWEYFADGLTNPQNIITDIVADPVSVVADVASMGIGGVGRRAATRGAEMVQRGLGSGTALQVAGRTAEGVATGIDAVATGGLSLAVPGVFKGAGKVLSATPLGKPTARALAEETEAATAELGGALLGERRVAGPVGSEMSAISNPVRGDRAITQVSLPAEGATPASTFAYRNDPRGVMVYDDPGTFRAMRRPTESDLGTVQELLGRVGQRDRQVLRDPWWDWAMRNRDAAGDDLVDPLWPELPARGSLPSVSTGRNRAAAQRHVDDLVSAMRRFDDPDGNRPVLYELLNDWRGTNFDNQLHPLTRRPMAEHRLETVKQVLNALPEHNNLYARRQIALMERQLPRTPGTIGTGMIWQAGKKAAAAGGGTATKTGTLVSYTPAHAERMSKLATIPSKEFFKGKAFAKADFASGLIARSAGASPRATNAYENWQGLLAARMNNPVLRRGDVGAMRDRFRGSVGGPVSVTAQKELDGLKDALDRTGILPGATTMDSASIEIALSRWLKANPSFRVEMPAGGAIIGPGGARPLGVYDPGSADEVLNMALPPDIRARMEETYDIGGTTYRVVDRLIDWQVRGEDMRALARLATGGSGGGIPRMGGALAPSRAATGGVIPPDAEALLRQRLDHLGLTDIGLEVVDNLARYGDRAMGVYEPWRKVIIIARDSQTAMSAADPWTAMRSTLDHEGIHAMRDLGVFREGEFEFLVDEARRIAKPEADGTFVRVAERENIGAPRGSFSKRDRAIADEEAVAELFAYYRMGQKGLSKPAQGIIQRIFDFMSGIIDSIRGTQLADMLDMIDSGEVGRRARGSSQSATNVRHFRAAPAARTPLTATQQRALDTFVVKVRKMHREYKDLTAAELATFGDAQIDRIAAASVGAEQGIAAGIRTSSGALKPRTTNPLLKTYDNITGMIRSNILYSPFRGVAYPLMQGMGNAFTNLIAAPGALRYYTPLDYRKVIRQIKDPEAAAALMPTALRIRDAIGLGRTGNLGRVSRDQMGGYTWFNDPSAGAFRRGAGKLLAPQWIKDTADAFDTLHRQSLWRSVFEPAYVRLKSDMPKMAITAFDEARRRTGLTLPVSADDLTDALKRLDLDNGGYYSAAQVREAIYAAAGGRSAPNSQEVYNVADRIHRLYREEVGKLDEAAQREVDRVAFNVGETNLDAFLQRTLMFSWWNTRAARLYLTELAKSPIQMALFARAVEAGNRNEQGGASPGYKDFTAFMQTPAGYTMMLNPFTLSSTVGTFASMEPVSEKAQLTALGEITEGGFLGNNLILNPIIKGALGFLGALGADYRQPDMTGISRMEREFNDAAEYVNFHVSQFYATRDGQPKAVPNLDLNSFQNVLAQKLSGFLPGTREVVERDPNIGQESAITIYVRDHLLELNPELGIPDADGKLYDLEHAVRDAMANPDSESYQVGLNKYVDSLYQGPGTDKGGALALIGAIARDNLPFQMNGMPTSRLDAKMRQNRDAIREDTGNAFLTAGTETTALDKQLGWLPYETAENRELELAQSDFFSAGDPATKEALAMAKEIKAGTTDVDVAGMSFSPDELAMLSQKDRNAVSNFWLNATGYGDAYEQREAAQDAALAADPRLADSLGWKEWVARYPGGPMRALEDTALVNPNVRRVTESQEWKDVVANGTPEDIEDAIGFMGPLVAGVKESRFGHAVDKAYRGVVGGMEGTVGQWYLQQRADGGEASFSSEKAAAVEADLADYQETVAALNAFDPSGASAAEYQANIMAGSSKPIPSAAYQAGIKGFTASDGEWFGQYLAWGMSEPRGMDTSPARWADEDSKAYYARRTMEIRTALDNGAYVPVEPVVEGEEVVTGLPDTNRPAFYDQVRVIPGGVIYEMPNGRTAGKIPSDVTLSVVEVGSDPAGTRWARVILPDGSERYVRTAELQKAA